MKIQDLPLAERPRERFVEMGGGALSVTELVAILLGTGTQERSAIALAGALLADFGTLERLADASLQELLAVKGIKMAKAVRLMTAFALGKRMRPRALERAIIETPNQAYLEMAPEIREEKVEVLYVLLRDARKRLLHKEAIGRGILNEVIMHPREIFHSAIRHRAHTLIVGHNHPSGDPSPSASDIEMTHTLRTAGKVMGIPVIDHIIVGREAYISFWEKGLLSPSEGY